MMVLVSPQSSQAFRARFARIFGAVRTMTAEDVGRINMIICPRWGDQTRPEAICAACADCGGAIAHMPYAPAGPPKVCGACAVGRLR